VEVVRPVALLLPSTAAVVAAMVTVRLGAPPPTASELSAWTDIVPFFLFALLVPLLGPWEEPGFRGFALSKLMQTHSVLAASLIVAAIIVFWHLPLFLVGDIPPADVVLILAAGVVFGALVVGSGGSVLLAMVMHATNNAVSGEYISQMFSGQDAATLGWIRAGVWCLFAVAALIIGGRRFWTQAPQEAATPVTGAEVRP
jgi:membrane protease YdiL (CAAX protease family)